MPPYQGERYEVMVPYTLDIQKRATLAINGLTGPLDPEKDYMLYSGTNFQTNPPIMFHRAADVCVTKFEEALPLLRLVSGSSLNDHVDPAWMANALRMIGPDDGLVYWHLPPWVGTPPWGVPHETGEELPLPAEDYYSCPSFTGRRISAMTTYLLRDPSGPWDEEIRKTVDGLWAIAIDKRDYAYFPQGEFYPNRPRVRDAALPVGIWSSLVGWTIQGLAQYHRVSGYEPAVDLADKLARYVIYHGLSYGPNGEFLPNYAGEDGGRVPGKHGVQGFDPGPAEWKDYIHFQHHMIPLLGTLDHALAVGDRELAEFVRQAFEWARTSAISQRALIAGALGGKGRGADRGTAKFVEDAFEWGRTRGSTLVGYFPEHINRIHDLQKSEICEVAGMIGLALKLSAAGLGDYWDDADRWIRNQFAEGQLLRADWAYRAGAEGPTMPDVAFDPVVSSCDRVPERNIGAFAGWPTGG